MGSAILIDSPTKNGYKKVCKNCGFTFGSHLANTVYNNKDGSIKHLKDSCPGHEGRMDWENGKVTTFEWDGTYKE